MTSSFQIKRIGEVCSVGDGAHSKVDRLSEGIPYLTSKNIGQGNLKLDQFDCISEEAFEKLFPAHSKATRRPQAGDVLFGIIGTFGNAYLYKESDKFGFSSSIGILRPGPHELHPKFLYYVLSSQTFKDNHANHNAGSVQGYTNIATVKSLEIPVPPFDDQIAIARILSSLDDKIELNRQTNQTLEQIAQALFKSWFVDFEPTRAKIAAQEAGASPEEIERAAMCAISGKTPDQLAQLPPETQQTLKTTAALFPDALVDSELGEMPEGWGIQKLEDIIELAYGKALKKEDRIDGEFPVYGSGGITGTNKESLVNGPGIIVGRKGTVGSLYWEDKNFFAIDTVFYVICKNNMTLEFSYYLLQTLGLEGMNTDAAVPGLNRNNAYRLEIVKAPEELISTFSNLTRKLRHSIRLNLEGIQSLQTIRDSLLPKLLSGELEVRGGE